jgi:hypothetical protein
MAWRVYAAHDGSNAILTCSARRDTPGAMFFGGASFAIAGMLASLLALSAACRDAASHKRPPAAPVVGLFTERHVESVAETRRILFGAGDRGFLLEGWSVDERDSDLDRTFVWATANEASVSFIVLDVVDEQFLVTLRAYPTPEPQTITVIVNGHEASRFTAVPIFLEYRFVVPAEWLVRGPNRLTFRHSTLGPPVGVPEARRLATAYNSILIGPQCLPLRGFGQPVQPGVRRQRKGRALVVTGPVFLQRHVRVPADAVLDYRMRLLPPAGQAVVSTVSIREGESVRDVAEVKLESSLFNRSPSREIEVDLRPWSGQTVDLGLEFRPETCRSSLTSLVVEDAGVYVGSGLRNW